MKSFAWRSLLVLVLAVALTSIVSDANAARRSSLAGNQFINDPDDMYAFPQLLLEYKNRIILQFAPDYSSLGNGEGDGSVTFGDNSVWQFNTGRGDFLANTAHWAWGGVDQDMGSALSGMNGLPGSNGSFGTGVEWWDVGFATMLGNNPWGFNISWASDSNKFTPDGADPTTDNSTSMFSIQAGTTFGQTELAAEIGFGSYSDSRVILDPSDMFDYSFFNVALLARGNLTGGGQNWRWIAAFANGSNSPKMTDAVSTGTTAFRGSFGPVWGTPKQWEVAAYMNFDYVKTEFPGSAVELKNTGTYFGFPSYNMAMEYYINNWLVARGGIVSHNASDKFETEVDNSGTIGKNEDKERTYELMWTAGIGVDKGEWGLDLALNDQNFHSGYVFGNGDVSGPVFSYISAWLAW